MIFIKITNRLFKYFEKVAMIFVCTVVSFGTLYIESIKLYDICATIYDSNFFFFPKIIKTKIW
jgi:hypothetical protein